MIGFAFYGSNKKIAYILRYELERSNEETMQLLMKEEDEEEEEEEGKWTRLCSCTHRIL